jgi:hypothetical protein
MYRSGFLVRESSDDLRVLMMFALSGLAISLLLIGRGDLYAEALNNVLLLF